MNFKAVVIGLSSGGMDVMKTLFSALPENYGIPIIIIQHMSPSSDSQWIDILNDKYPIRIKEAEEKENVVAGTVYIAPPNYHLLLENDGTFSLSIDERVSYARPSIDVFFETAAQAFGKNLIGVVMTGSNHDGAAGLLMIKKCGGVTIVQNPETAFSSFMPREAITHVNPDKIYDLERIIEFLISIDKKI